MDFLEARNAAAREIALAIGVPPQLLGIPGDNTYSNYQEANRDFWRQTVIPLVNRIAAAFTAWLAKPHDATFAFRPDYDQVDALNPERDTLWSRLNSATFLTTNEKRSAAGYGPYANGDDLKRHFATFMARGGFTPDASKYNPNRGCCKAGSRSAACVSRVCRCRSNLHHQFLHRGSRKLDRRLWSRRLMTSAFPKPSPTGSPWPAAASPPTLTPPTPS